MRKLALFAATLAAAVAAGAIGTGTVRADPNNKLTRSETLSCDNGQTVEVVYQVTAPFHAVSSTSNFVITALSVTNPTLPDHTFFVVPGFERNAVQRVTCTYTATASNGSTSTFTAVGFFTPPSS